jgi:D-3-phosphoglycerate dehydrogenase
VIKSKKVLITTVPFGEKNRMPLDMLESNNIEYVINPFNKKLTESELESLISDFDVVVAGTEKITSKVMDAASNLKLISRVGIGLDSVDLLAAKDRGIEVSYTPDAPAPAVAELTKLNVLYMQVQFMYTVERVAFTGAVNNLPSIMWKNMKKHMV